MRIKGFFGILVFLLLVPGKGFNWNCPDHFRVVYLPNVRQLEKAMDKLKDFLSTYKQR